MRIWRRRRRRADSLVDAVTHKAYFQGRVYNIPDVWIADWCRGAILRAEPATLLDAIAAWAHLAATDSHTGGIMKFILEIDCNNEAFAGEGEVTQATAAREVTRILEKAKGFLNVAELTGRTDGTLRDINGNTVGSFAFTEEN